MAGGRYLRGSSRVPRGRWALALAAPRDLTLNKLCTGSGETLGRNYHRVSSSARGWTHPWGQSCIPGDAVVPGTGPGRAGPPKDRGRVCTGALHPQPPSLHSPCTFPGLFHTKPLFSSAFSFFFSPPRESCTETDGFILHESLMI